jgi:hypothetical protein
MQIEPSTGLPEDIIRITEEISTPNAFDDFFALTHKNAKASWDDVAEEDDSDECEEDSFDDEDLL